MPVYEIYNGESLLFRYLSDEIKDEKTKKELFFMHIHDYFEILYFISGNAVFMVETTAIPLRPDTLILMRPLESHTINLLGNEPYERFTINFSAELLDAIDPAHKLLDAFFDRPLGVGNAYHASEFSIHPRKLFEAMLSSEKENERLNILANFYALLGQIDTAFRSKRQEISLPPNTLAGKVAEYINAHLFAELSVRSLASRFYVSVSQLNRQFKQATGFAPWDYIVGKRLISARNLIRGGKPATTAFSECGFNDYSSFYRHYLKRFGVPPKADAPKKHR